MPTSIEQITIESLSLAIQYRALLAEKLIASLDDKVFPDTVPLWIKEEERRFQEIQDGTVICRPAEEVLGDARENQII